MQRRSYFFDPLSPQDRFKTQDIPTEQTFRELTESVPFFKEADSAAFNTKAGIVKLPTDAQVNLRANNDIAGVSPVGFPMMVRSSQVPKLLPDDNTVIITPRPRTLADPNTSFNGDGILDWYVKINPAVIPAQPDYHQVDVERVPLQPALNVPQVNGVVPTLTKTLVNLNPPLPAAQTNAHDLMVQVLARMDTMAQRLVELATYADRGEVEIGDVVMTPVSPGQWGSNWMEPNGALLSQSLYPALYAKIGNGFSQPGDPAGTFRLPNWANNRYLLMVPSSVSQPSVGGITSHTLSMANIPAHSHQLGVNATVSTSGDHSHDFPMRNDSGDNNSQFPETGRIDGQPMTGYTNNAGSHTHTVGGRTEDTGQVSPAPIPITPLYNGVYIKMRVS